jgi:adenylate cyclase
MVPWQRSSEKRGGLNWGSDFRDVTSVRRLAAIMFTDMVGYTASVQAQESDALRTLEEQERVVRPLFTKFRGREIKSTGDGFLVEFASALSAVECAIAIHNRLGERNARGGLSPIQVRIGIHLGDVEARGSDIFGDSVNIAARVEPLAEPGGICITEPVFGQVRNKLPYSFEKIPTPKLKGVDSPIEVYRIVMPAEAPPSRKMASPPGRIAVLPFVNISPDPNDEYFADGMTEELISKLSEVPDLRVIARTSVMNYKRKERRLADIGKELGVGSIIEGSVRRSGNRLRVTVQLVDPTTEEHVWASKYDEDLDDIFVIQSDVASKVAGALVQGGFAGTLKKDTEDAEAYTCYLRALQLMHQDTRSGRREAVELFERAIDRDPRFARAYAGLAQAWNRRVWEDSESWDRVRDRAEVAARRALELAPDLAEGHAALSEVYGMLDRFEESIAEATRAIELNPNLSEVYATIGLRQASFGDLEQAVTALRKAHELDPLSVRTGLTLAWVVQLAGHETEAREILERMDRLSPKDPRIYDGFAEFYQLKGDFAKAREVLDEGLRDNPGYEDLRGEVGVNYALTGRRKEAERVAREADGFSTPLSRLLTQLFIRAALGDVDEAFEALMPLAEMHAWPSVITVHPIFAKLRHDPRFAAFRKKVGLPMKAGRDETPSSMPRPVKKKFRRS